MMFLAVKIHVLARKTHKWLGLFIGLQVVIWSLSGLYMTVVHIDTIHGDHLVRATAPASTDAANLDNPLKFAVANQASSVRLVFVRKLPAYALQSERGERRVISDHCGAYPHALHCSAGYFWKFRRFFHIGKNLYRRYDVGFTRCWRVL